MSPDHGEKNITFSELVI